MELNQIDVQIDVRLNAAATTAGLTDVIDAASDNTATKYVY